MTLMRTGVCLLAEPPTKRTLLMFISLATLDIVDEEEEVEDVVT